ncbi:hypothetical protein ACOMHN_021023 [Nucella lapillus]
MKAATSRCLQTEGINTGAVKCDWRIAATGTGAKSGAELLIAGDRGDDKCGLCAKLAPARESVPSVPSYNVEGEQDPLARLSKVFGISRIPAKAIHRTPPQYMTELFREVADTGGLTKASGPYDANTIRSFPDRAFSILSLRLFLYPYFDVQQGKLLVIVQ